jgi:dienelactone hydrolase
MNEQPKNSQEEISSLHTEFNRLADEIREAGFTVSDAPEKYEKTGDKTDYDKIANHLKWLNARQNELMDRI